MMLFTASAQSIWLLMKASSSSAIRSYLSNVNKFKRQCGYVYMMYDVIAPSYGISVK